MGTCTSITIMRVATRMTYLHARTAVSRLLLLTPFVRFRLESTAEVELMLFEATSKETPPAV